MFRLTAWISALGPNETKDCAAKLRNGPFAAGPWSSIRSWRHSVLPRPGPYSGGHPVA